MERMVWTVAEVQAQLGLRHMTAYKLCRQLGVKIGKRLLVPKARLAAYLELEAGAIDLTGIGR